MDGPQQIGPYRVLRELGAGGMGRVYLGTSPGGRAVAVKLIRPELAGDPGFRHRFAAEVRAARAVSGAYTAPVVDADPDGEQPWLATAYVPGPTLQELVGRDGPLDGPRLRALAAGLAEALASIHSAGVVHADLTPRNVIMATDGPRVIDFGISRALEGAQTTGVLGTPGYLSPEQVASGCAVGPASDVFTLGAVLVFAATGRPPFGAGLPASQLYRVVHEVPDLDGVPAPLSPLIRACMAKSPEARPAPQAVLAVISSPTLAPAVPHVPVAPGSSSSRAAVPAGVGYPSAPGFAPTQTVPGGPAGAGLPPAPAGYQAAPGKDPVPFRPDGASWRSAPSRRWLLGMAGGAAVAAAGLVVALAESGRGSGAGTAASGSTVGGHAGSASWSQAPQPAPAAGSQPASLAALGDAVIWYGDSMALAYDASTGAPRWSGASKTPSRAAGPSWYGVYGTTLVGSVPLSLGAANVQLFGLTQDGGIAFNAPVPDNFSAGLLGLNGGVALLQQDSPPALCAYSTSGGRNLWSYPWSATTTSGAVSDGQRAYVYSDLNLTALGLRSGSKIWSIPVTASYGGGTHDYIIFLGGGVVLLVGDTGVFAYDPASGRQLWKSGSWSPYALSDSAIYALSTDYADGPAIASLSPRTGQPRWRYQLTAFTQFASVPAIAPLQSNADSQVVALPCAAGSLAGLVVLDAATGRPLWAHSSPLPPGSAPLLVAVSGTSVFAATPSALYGFTG